MRSPGKIVIEGLKSRVRIGCTAEERAYTQNISFDIAMDMDMEAAVKSDDLSATVDYMAVTTLIEQQCASTEWRLLEKLSADIGQEILEAFPVVHSVEVGARKFILPNAEGVRCVIRTTR